MEEPIVLIFEDKDKLVKGLTEFFVDVLNQKDRRFSVALSGGSTPKIWFEYLAKNHNKDIDWERIHFYWGDERCVPPTDGESNYGMTKKNLLDHIDIPRENIHRIQGELAPDAAADIYAKELIDDLALEAIPKFDLVILGMGDDGHTASIFPHQIELWNSDDFSVVATHPETGQQRVSITGQVINYAEAVAFLVTGEQKAQKVHEILYNEDSSSKYPASLVNPESNNLYWFLDKDAAKQVK